MDQPTYADLEYQGKKRKTRRELFLGRMDALIPWELLEERIHPFYHKAGGGRHPNLLSVMLRVHCVSATAVNAHVITEAHNLLHGGETVVWGDAGYQRDAQAGGEPGGGMVACAAVRTE